MLNRPNHFYPPCQGRGNPKGGWVLSFFHFLPSLLWMSLIFYLSSRSTTGIGHGETQRFLILKSFHLIEYGILLILLFFGFKRFKYSIITAYLYAISDELHQLFVPGREGRIRDTFIDLLGIMIGIVILKIVYKFSLYKRIFK